MRGITYTKKSMMSGIGGNSSGSSESLLNLAKSIATEYDGTKSDYQEGDIVLYDEQVYVRKNDASDAEGSFVSSNWRSNSLGDEIASEFSNVKRTFSGAVEGGTINIGNGNFVVDSDGNVTLKGNITWSAGNNPATSYQVYAVYSVSLLETPYGTYSAFPSTGYSVWHRNLDVENDYYVSYSYDNGNTWSAAIKMRGSDGASGGGSSGSSTVTRNDIAEAMLNANPNDGLYAYTYNGNKYLAINASYIRTGMISDTQGNNYWNLDTGEFHLDTSAAVGDSTLQDVVDSANASITNVDVQYAKSTSSTNAPTSGWSTNPPAWEEGYYIWQRTATTLGDGSTTYSASRCITGVKGDTGKGISSTVIRYGLSNSESSTPSSWSASPPALTQGKWLWCRTVITYSDSSTSTSYSKSYIGTDGEDGKSVAIQSATKTNGVTTLVLSDGTTTSTLTIADGEDGDNGTPGKNGYVHVAWANSADGSSDFSTSVSSGKSYIGVYTDNTSADSTTYSDYSWSLIKGAKGDTGKGVSSIVEQYYLSTSSTTQSGGSWSSTCPDYVAGKHYWTRSSITWSDGTTTTTTPVLAQGLNLANANANIVATRFGTCTTAASTVAKVVTCSGFTLNDGAVIEVLFTNTNTASGPTLNVNSTGAKTIKVLSNGSLVTLSSTSEYNWVANSSVIFRYDNSSSTYIMMDANSRLDQTRIFNYLTKNGTAQGITSDPNTGDLYINATYINSGILSADRIGAGSITAAKIAAGSITADKLSATALNSGNISLYGNMEVYEDEEHLGDNNYIGGYLGYGTGNNGSSTTSGMKMSDASGDKYLIVTTSGVRMTASGSSSCDIYVTSTSPTMRNGTPYVTVLTTGPVVRYSSDKQIYVTTDGPTLKHKTTEIQTQHGAFVNIGSQATALGTTNHPWSGVYSGAALTVTSDRKKKYDVSYDIDKYVDMFDEFSPVSYKLVDGESGRTHLGLIAQDVEAIMNKHKIDSKIFAAFIKSTEDGVDYYGLRYEEFIPLLIAKVQKQQMQINELMLTGGES